MTLPSFSLASLAVAVGLALAASAHASDDHSNHGGDHKGHGETMAAAHLADIRLSGPYIRSTPPRAPVAGGYLTIENTGDQPDRLLGGSVDFAERVEIHEMKMDGDVMRMRPIKGGLIIAPGKTLILKPGANHIMFIGLGNRLVAGETHDVTLTFETAGDVTLTFEVRDLRRRSNGGHGDHGSRSHSN